MTRPGGYHGAALLASALSWFFAAPWRLFRLSDSDVLVVCLCARWCGVCRDYERVFAQVATRFSATRFLWIDVEDQADRIDPIEVDNFPTLLIAVGQQPHFFGTLTPQPQMLERIVRERIAGADPALTTRIDLRDLVVRLQAEI